MRESPFHTPLGIMNLATLAVLAISLTLGAGACAPHEKTASGQAAAPQNPEAGNDWQNTYARAMRAFQTGDYQGAAALFESLGGQGDGAAQNAQALYGLACSLLAKSGSREDVAEALAVWREWQGAPNGSPCPADPRMLTPFLENSDIFLPKEQPVRQRAQTSRPNEPDLTKRLQQKEKQVQLLQKQIKALEAIHQEIQEKKKMSN